jgi:23S rRNA pseudouridine1911/1915/1917 synthase
MPKVEIVYEDNDVIAINKPAGLLVHKTRVSQEPTLVDWLLKNFPEIKNVGDDPTTRPGIVHRLDKETSGIMIIARNQKAFEYLKKLFQTRQIKKTYLALVWGKVKEKTGVIEKPLGIKSGTLKRIVSGKVRMVKEAKTVYKVIKFIKLKDEDLTLLEVEPLTGRTHQIRAHLASIGHPVVGDTLYGKKPAPVGLARQFLHAESLELTLPSGSRIKIVADLPEDLGKFLET